MELKERDGNNTFSGNLENRKGAGLQQNYKDLVVDWYWTTLSDCCTSPLKYMKNVISSLAISTIRISNLKWNYIIIQLI